MTLASGSLLAQLRPADLNNAPAFQATLNTEVTLLVVSNTSGAPATFRLFHAADNLTFNQTTALFWDKNVAAGDSFILGAGSEGSGIQIQRNEGIAVRSSVANALTFSIYGVTEQLAKRVRGSD